MRALIASARACKLCCDQLPDDPRPVFQAHPKAKILIAGQAPGRNVQVSGIPFDDASGDRLRTWMGIDSDVFYDHQRVAILPMGFCYPGKGASGDLPPRPECAPAWRQQFLAAMPDIQLTLVIGAYAQRWHLNNTADSLTGTVRNWRSYQPAAIPLPHPSPRNNIWLKKNAWFTEELLPVLQQQVAKALG